MSPLFHTSKLPRTISTSSCDIARPVSPRSVAAARRPTRSGGAHSAPRRFLLALGRAIGLLGVISGLSIAALDRVHLVLVNVLRFRGSGLPWLVVHSPRIPRY